MYFLKYGFENAPLRNIVKDAGFTLGAFYGYYKTKEELFYELTDATAREFGTIILSIYEDMTKLQDEDRIFLMLDCYLERLEEIVDYICKNKTEMILLLKCSNGTKYENFMDNFRVRTGDYISQSAKNTTTRNLSVNPSLIEILMRGYFGILSQIIVEMDDKEEIYRMMYEVALVYKNGILSVMNGGKLDE